MSNSRNARRVAQIKASVPIIQLLSDYGYHVHLGGDYQEQQFSCDLHGDGRDGKPSARAYPASNSFYCVHVEEPILTDMGWRPLKDLAQSTALQVLDGCREFASPTHYWDAGVKACFRVETNLGYHTTLTADHLIFSLLRGWIPVQDLRKGEPLRVVTPVAPSFNDDARIPVAVSNDGKSNLPIEWNLEIGEFLGYIFGDGSVVLRPRGSFISLSSHSSDYENSFRIYQSMQKWSGRKGHILHRTDKATTPNGNVYDQDQYTFNVGSIPLCNWVGSLGLDKQRQPKDRRIPNLVWGATKDAIRGFLRGVFATDGSVVKLGDRLGVRICLYSVSPNFLRDVQLLLLQFGIVSGLSANASTRADGVWQLRITTLAGSLQFRETIGIANTRKAAVLDTLLGLPKIKAPPSPPTVSSVTYVGDLPVADITMPDSPSFVAGGLQVHNCFACDVTRDAVATVRAKEGLGFLDALTFLERKFNLPSVPWEDTDETEAAKADPQSIFAGGGGTKPLYPAMHAKVAAALAVFTEDRLVPMAAATGYWEALDKIAYDVERKTIGEVPATAILERLYLRLVGDGAE